MHRRIFFTLFLSFILCVMPGKMPVVFTTKSVMASNILEYLKAEADYQFGQTLSFQLLVESGRTITHGTVTFKEVSGSTTGLVPVNISPQNPGTYLLSAAIDLTSFPLRAFSQVQYRFDAYMEDGNTIQSPDFFFSYLDNRFNWQSLENRLLRVHWIGEDSSLGEKVLDSAQKGMERISSLLDWSNTSPIDIYVYNQVDDLKLTLPANKPGWSLGHAEPELNHILVALPVGPEQEFLIQQHIPHEIMHIIVSRIAGNGSTNLPNWLGEGLATLAELYPNPDYAVVMEKAREQNRLLPIQSLCSSFPQDSSNAVLAYAQSASFVRYLFNRFETEGIKDLIAAYQSGAECSDGVQTAFGESLQQLESQWLGDSIGQNDLVVATNDLTPWFVLLISIFFAPLLAMFISLRRKNRKIAR